MVARRRPAALSDGRPIDRPLCRLDEIAIDHSRGFDPLDEGRDTMFVVRRGDDVHGYRNACPHYDQARMAWRKDEFLNADRTYIMCGAHGALFRPEDGLCVAGPCVGAVLTRVPLALRDGAIWITGAYRPGLRGRAGRASG